MALDTADPTAPEDRRAALALLALAEAGEMSAALDAPPDAPRFETVRAPEIGLVMARGRIGGGGAPFNLGEVTVTRAVVRAESGEVGFGHILGRDTNRALMVAKLDALWQSRRYRDNVQTVINAVRDRIQAADAITRRKTAATRVNFFTLVRGEDQ